MLRQLIEKLFGIETVNMTIADIAPALQDPCCRHINQSSREIYSIFDRGITGDFVGNAASTPETVVSSIAPYRY